MRVVVVGTAGADPAGLADAVRDHGWAGEISVAGDPAGAEVAAQDAHAVLLALDPGFPACDEETALLHVAARCGVPTGLVATHVDRFPAWPKTVAASRATLDPEHVLPVFATATSTGAHDESIGVADVVRWCLERPDGESVPVAPRPVDRAARPAPSRAERLSMLRAGVVALRAEAVVALRESMRELSRRADESEPGPESAAWLAAAVDTAEARLQASVQSRVDQLRWSALDGLPPGSGEPRAVRLDVGERGSPTTRARNRTEDAMVLAVGASMGFGVGRMVIAPALAWAGLGAAGTVLSLIAGLLLAAWAVAGRRSMASRAEHRQRAGETLALRRSAVEHRIGAELGAVEAAIGKEIWNRSRAAGV